MERTAPVHRLDQFLTTMHDRLFPAGFATVNKDDLVDQIGSLTRLVNETLRWYHGLTEEDGDVKHEASPLLTFSQDLLTRLCRLAIFDQPMLTRHNQILADTAAMLAGKATLLATTYKEQADYQRRIAKDEKLRELMDTFLGSFMNGQG